MARQYRIRRSKNLAGASFKARPHPVAIALIIIALAGLFYLGTVIYGPVSEFIMSLGAPEQSVPPESKPDIPEPVSSEPESSSLPAEPEKPKATENLRAVYLPFDIASDIAAARSFLDNISADVNAVMVEIKTNQGLILFDTLNENAIAWGAVPDIIIDLPGIAALLKKRDMHLIVTMHAFSDPIAARGNRELNAIKYQNSEMLWLDNYADRGGKPWLNPYVPEVRSYLVDIAAEAVELGAVMVVLESAYFPDYLNSSASFGPSSLEIGRAEALASFIGEVRGALEPLGARTAVYIPVTAIEQSYRDSRYGGNPLEISEEIVLGVMPELVETGYIAEGTIITRPAADISKMIMEALQYAKSRPASRVPGITPMLGANPEGTVPITWEKLMEQIAACADSGNSEFILFSQSGAYPQKP